MVEFEQYKYEWNQYKDKVKELAASFDIETKENRIREIEEAMEQQEFWDDVEKSQKLMKELKNLKSQIDTISKIQRDYEDIGILIDMGNEEEDAPQRQRAQLAFELSRYGQVAGFAEKILRIVDPPVLGAGRIVQIERRHLEHGARTLAVGGRDERRVPVVEAAVVEELVDGEGHGVTDAQHRAERIGTRTQV